MKNKKVISAISIVFIIVLGILGYIALGEKNSSNKENTNNEQEEVKGNYNIVEAMQHIKATNTVEEINAIIGFESTTDAMIGSDPIWKFDSKNWISFKTYGNDNITIQATIDKESIKNNDIVLPSSSDLQKDLNNGSFTYEELVEKVGGNGILTSISKDSLSYTWVDKTGQRLGATFNNESGKCTVASYR